jgi:phenylpropionate dioxygenase-like ring-hydroxylating dioxygenase large terminal subunit
LTDGKVLGVRLLGEDLVLWRTKGEVMAWRDLCIHRGTRLSLGKVHDSILACPYHGWEYNHEGSCVRMPAHPDQTPPAKARAHTYLAKESYGLIWVMLGEPQNDIPPFPEDPDPSYRKVLVGPFGPINASAPRLIENFLDVAHFPFVHG